MHSVTMLNLYILQYDALLAGHAIFTSRSDLHHLHDINVALSRALALAVARARLASAPASQARPQWREGTWLGEI